MKHTKIIPTLLTLVSLLQLLASCNSSDAKGEERKPAEAGTAPVVATLLKQDSLVSAIRIPGELTAFQNVDMYAKVNSFVKKIYVDAGTEVVAGQLLATLEAPEINSQLSAAASRLKMQEAVYTASKATYNRLLETSKTPGTISPNDLELAHARQQSDEASLNAARAQYAEVVNNRDYLQVRSPFNGVISSRNISPGAYVGPSGRGSELPMFTLVEQKKLRLVVSIPEAHTGYLKNNSQIKFIVRSQPGDTFSAKLSRQSGALDPRLRAERIEMDVLNENKKLLPGMVADVLIPLNSEDRAFVIPTTAVLNSTEGVFVIKVKDQKTVWVPVTTTRNFDGKTEIYGKLSVNDTLVKFASEEVRNGGVANAVKLE